MPSTVTKYEKENKYTILHGNITNVWLIILYPNGSHTSVHRMQRPFGYSRSPSIQCGALPDDNNRTKVGPPALFQDNAVGTLADEAVTGNVHRTKPGPRT